MLRRRNILSSEFRACIQQLILPLSLRIHKVYAIIFNNYQITKDEMLNVYFKYVHYVTRKYILSSKMQCQLFILKQNLRIDLIYVIMCIMYNNKQKHVI